MSANPTNLAHLRHDLRTPINQILGYSELLMEETADAGHNVYDADLKKIRQAAKQLLNLINDNLTDERLSLSGQIVDAGALTAAPFPFASPGSRAPQVIPAAAASATPLAPPVATGSAESFPVPPDNYAALLLSSKSAADEQNAPLPGHILVVDDNEGNRDMLSRQLLRQGHTVETAENGRLALERLRAEAFDLVLLDMMMPELDGYGTLDAIKSDPALRHLPVIMISALDELASVVRCIERGAEDFLPKPFNPTLLRARIGAGMEKKRFRDQERTYVKQIEETQARLQAELTEAENYVRSILPPAGLSRHIPVDWRLIPSTELGGDSFGYHWIDDDHFAIYLLDVCGHGVGAALLSVTAINVLRNAALPGVDFREPGEMLTALNEAFLMEKQNDMYFTIWYGVWKPSTRTLRFASAGHPPALLATARDDGKRDITPLKGAGMILGGMSGATYRTFEQAIPGPARLYIVSDGTFEIALAGGSMWEFTDFVGFMAGRPQPGESDLDRLFAHVKTLHGPGPLDDDFSIVGFTL
jgi:sigma-B regulation protein RsbU (phosphoserine phosphatase)